MANKRKATGSKQVDSYDHEETRLNIPTADAAGTFFNEESQSLPPLRYPRDASLDPQLVWNGKDSQNGDDLVVDTPPIYIQEKIVPRALIENLRERSAASEYESEPTLFDMFDGLDELSQVEFYQHEESWKNRMILGDGLQVMGSLAERESLRGKVQAIYMDPPYGISFGSNWQPNVGNRTVKDGDTAHVPREVEQIRAFRDTWELGIHSYLSYLRDRLIIARDLLTPTGSIFLQIGEENLHRVRLVLDEVFGDKNFCGQFAFRTKIPLRTTLVPAIYDYILWYAVDKEAVKFRRLFRTRRTGEGTQFTRIETPDGSRRPLTRRELDGDDPMPEGRLYRLTDLVSAGRTESCVFPFDFEGRTFAPSGGKSWKTNKAGIEKLIAANRIEAPARTPAYCFFADDYPVEELPNVWTDTQGASDRIYVVQTSSKVIERCLLMATDPGDLVLDPTCGSGTTAHIAEKWGRRWITVDTSRVAIALARQRIMASRFPFFVLSDSAPGRAKEGLAPAATAGSLRSGFVYAKVPHVTLGSITSNPDVGLGMSKENLDSAIRRHADFEYLYDQPAVDNSRIRVSGPFTVETLAPHRSLSLDTLDSENDLLDAHNDQSFENSIIENLRAAGIQNGIRDERLTFSEIDPYPNPYIQAIGTQSDSGKKISIALGPRYGTVSAGFIKQAAKEAVALGTPTLTILGFAFDPQLGIETDEEGFAAVAGVRDLGKVKVLVVRMNVDLLMGDELKKTGAGNLFTVFGEPDLDLRREGDKWVVEVRGVDVYDPTSGHIRSNSTKEVALWMVDSNYDGESFFVRHAYFLGDNDPYKALKTALKADIDPEAWATLYRSVSVPFKKPETGKIAVKVINDYGDEVMKVLEVS
jgi:adenine-specific DNA-methyltransferase